MSAMRCRHSLHALLEDEGDRESSAPVAPLWGADPTRRPSPIGGFRFEEPYLMTESRA